MAVAMLMHWDGVRPDQYDALMARLGLDSNPAAGEILHLATFTDEGLQVYEVWRTESAFTGFLQNRLLPVAGELGLSPNPVYELVPLHHMYVADPDMVDRIGMMSVPAAVASWVA
jgi:hypothetical protein